MFEGKKFWCLQNKIVIAIFAALACLLLSVAFVHFYTVNANPPSGNEIPVFTYRIVAAYPHNQTAFTEGLVYYDGFLYEGAGLYGQSRLQMESLDNGTILESYSLPSNYFGEGVTIMDGRIYQLTWLDNTGFVYNLGNFTLLEEFHYPTEGWGLTNNGSCLIMSDGTATLYFLDPSTFATVGQIEVHDNNGPVTQLNELEYVNGEIYANIWLTNRIVQISVQTGQVLGYIDLTGLSSHLNATQPVDELNGIAYDSVNDRLFVTGKFWPAIFQIELVPETTP